MDDHQSSSVSWMKHFFDYIVHRFRHGSLPYQNTDELLAETRILSDYPFTVHSGPLESAIQDARAANQTLIIYIYSDDNYCSSQVDSVLSEPSVVEEMSHFTFYSVDICHPEGWSAAHFFSFKCLPLLVLLRPRGTSLSECHVYAKHEGIIGEITLLSYLTMHRHTDAGIVQQQDEEYRRAIEEAEANTRTTSDLNEECELEQKLRVENEFAAISIPSNNSQAATIRFFFPDLDTQTRVFCQSAPQKQLFAFARRFVFPRSFTLKTGFPFHEIEEGEDPIGALSPDRQFVIHVEIS